MSTKERKNLILEAMSHYVWELNHQRKAYPELNDKYHKADQLLQELKS